MNKILLLLATLLAIAIAYEYVPITHRGGAPSNSGWSVIRRSEKEGKTKFLISLQQQNLYLLEKKFWENSDPTNPQYAKHMTRDEINKLTKPSDESVRAVLQWIKDITSQLPKGHLFSVEVKVDAIEVHATNYFAEQLFQTEMFLYYNDRSDMLVNKHLGPFSIPLELTQHITLVTGITELPPIKSELWVNNRPKKTQENGLRQSPDNQCNNPYTIKNLYSVPETLTITNKNSNASIYAEDSVGNPEGFGLGSIEDYQNALNIPKNPIKCILGDGVANYITNDTDLEANLDTEMMTGMAIGVDTCFYIMEYGSGWMYEFTREVFNTPNAPLVVSMSYGWNEVDSCINVTAGYDFLGNCSYYHIPNSEQYVNLTNINFQKLGLMGHTLLAASGDSGTAGTHGSLNGCATMGPIFPAASPYVLTVGATSVEVSDLFEDEQVRAGSPHLCTDTFYQCTCTTSQNEQPASENNTAEFDSGGGFSMYSPMPSYQTQAVQAYLKSGVTLPPTKYFNGANRGFPDVAAVGEQVCLLDPGQPCDFVGGTSASTPLWGSLITFFNNDRLNANKTSLGFVNQVLYNAFYTDNEKYFNNKFENANNAGGCPEDMGFNAKSGVWTPITGLGSPNFPLIREFINALPY